MSRGAIASLPLLRAGAWKLSPRITQVSAFSKTATPLATHPRGSFRPYSAIAGMGADTATESVDTVERDGKVYRTITEGKATILVPQGAKVGEDRGEVQQVFYNPIQQYNRDLSVLAIKTYGEQAVERKRGQVATKKNNHGKKRKREERGEVTTEDGGPKIQDATQTPDETQAREAAREAVRDSAQGASEGAEPKIEAPKKPYNPTFKILDALSASGLRALRYAHELPFVTAVTANDLSESAAESIKLNVAHNGLEDKISVTNDDALAHMYRAIADDLSHRDRRGGPMKSNKFDVIDLDPYGTAAPFFDAAVQAVRDDGGLLCITCTDSAVWAGHSYCEKTYALYGGTPIKGMHSHEGGLRLIINAVATSAARYGITIEPLLSLSIDFYTKVFIRVTKSPNAVKFLGSKTMLVYSCDQGCGAWETQPLMKSKAAANKKGSGTFYKHGMVQGPTADRHCEHCGTRMHINGPMYAGYIHSREFIQGMLEQIPKADPAVYRTLTRLEGMLRTALEELIPGPAAPQDVDPKQAELAVVDPYPFYVITGKLAGVLSCVAPPDDMFVGALTHLGYRVGRSHCRAGTVKTDAPWSTVWWVMTEWIRQKSPVKTSKFKPSMPAWKILHDAGIVGQEASTAAEEPPRIDQDAEMEGVDEPAAAGEPASVDTVSEPQEQTDVPDATVLSESDLRKTLVFDSALAQLGRRRREQGFVRYQMNPRANWGPLSKAKGR